MIETSEVIEYFDRLAADWDSGIVRNEEVIETIMNNAGVSEGKDILDVACGTGVLIPDYLKRNVLSVTAIDISPNMVARAQNKFSLPNVSIICGDVEKTEFDRLFDCIVIYNAFPDAERLVSCLSRLLKPGGLLTVAHGMSRNRINAHHRGSAQHVSNGLMSAEDLARIFEKYLTVTEVISDDSMYQVCGKTFDRS